MTLLYLWGPITDINFTIFAIHYNEIFAIDLTGSLDKHLTLASVEHVVLAIQFLFLHWYIILVIIDSQIEISEIHIITS